MRASVKLWWHHLMYAHRLIEDQDSTAQAMFVTPRRWRWWWGKANVRSFARVSRLDDWTECDAPADVFEVLGLNREEFR